MYFLVLALKFSLPKFSDLPRNSVLNLINDFYFIIEFILFKLKRELYFVCFVFKLYFLYLN